MNKSGPIIVIEDDVDDRDLLKMVFDELGHANQVRFFEDGEAALEFMQDDAVFPFLILSDINMPKLDGFKLKEMVQTNDDLSKKCIPYLFFTTAVNQRAVFDAYTMSAQGFFLKPDSYETLRLTIKTIIDYWKLCYSPNFYDMAKYQPSGRA
jgi:CheY-like chemotaxis protein